MVVEAVVDEIGLAGDNLARLGRRLKGRNERFWQGKEDHIPRREGGITRFARGSCEGRFVGKPALGNRRTRSRRQAEQRAKKKTQGPLKPQLA